MSGEPQLEIIYKEVKDLVGYQTNQLVNLNDRIGWLLAFSALNISALMISIYTVSQKQSTSVSSAPLWLFVLFDLDVLLYLLVLIFGYIAHRISIDVIDLEGYASDEDLLIKGETHVKEWLVARHLELYKANDVMIKNKTKYLNYAYLSLVAAVALLLLALLLEYFSVAI